MATFREMGGGPQACLRHGHDNPDAAVPLTSWTTHTPGAQEASPHVRPGSNVLDKAPFRPCSMRRLQHRQTGLEVLGNTAEL